MNKLRARGLYISAVGIVPALSTAFQWDNIIAYALIFLLSILFLGITERENKATPPRSCLVILIQMVVIPAVLVIAAAAIVWLGQQFGIPFTQLIYLVSGLVCLVGLAMFIWSFRVPPDQNMK